MLSLVARQIDVHHLIKAVLGEFQIELCPFHCIALSLEDDLFRFFREIVGLVHLLELLELLQLILEGLFRRLEAVFGTFLAEGKIDLQKSFQVLGHHALLAFDHFKIDGSRGLKELEPQFGLFERKLCQFLGRFLIRDRFIDFVGFEFD